MIKTPLVDFFSAQGKRTINEDFILSKSFDSKTSLHIVADGMGGYEDGRFAAELISKTLFESLCKCLKPICNDDICNAVVDANNLIKNAIRIKGIKIGATFGAVYIDGFQAKLFWVGDVKIGYISSGKIKYESKSHTLVNAWLDLGVDIEEIKCQNIDHLVTKSIAGKDDNYNPDIVDVLISNGDKIVVYSDGLLEIIKNTNVEDLDISSIPLLSCKSVDSTDNVSMLVMQF
jgi:serine/threonine protein phosphatase PrpC